MSQSMFNYAPVTREHILQLRRKVEEQAEKEKKRLVYEGVTLLYERTYNLIKAYPYNTSFMVYIREFSLNTDYQKKDVMKTILEETRILFPEFEVLESTITAYEYTFTLKDSD